MKIVPETPTEPTYSLTGLTQQDLRELCYAVFLLQKNDSEKYAKELYPKLETVLNDANI